MKIFIFYLIVFQAIIYPQVSPVWTSFFNGGLTNNLLNLNCAFDDSCNAYFTGNGGFPPTYSKKILTVKCDINGNELWSKIYNGPTNHDDYPLAIFIDNSGNIYITGMIKYNDLFKILTIKYSSYGDLLWESVFDSTSMSDGRANTITGDNNGNIYLTGRYSFNENDDYEIITLKINAENGEILQYKTYGKVLSGYDEGLNIAMAENGNIYVAGISIANLNFEREIVLIKYNSDLDTLWTAHINGTSESYNETSVDIDLDNSNNIVVLGKIQNDSTSLDFGLYKFNSLGEKIWSTSYDVFAYKDNAEDMVIDEQGNIFVTGSVREYGSLYIDIAILKYNNSGELQWNSFYTGAGKRDDRPAAIYLDNEKNIYVSGASYNPLSRFLVLKYNPNGEFIWDYLYNFNSNFSSNSVGLKVDDIGDVYSAGQSEDSVGLNEFFALKLSSNTDVQEKTLNNKNFSLSQNYPNPFNPTTKIKYSIPAGLYNTEKVQLKVYDILGNEITTLVNNQQQPGNYEVTFKGTNLSSGIYFYTIRVGTFISTKKMVLLK